MTDHRLPAEEVTRATRDERNPLLYSEDWWAVWIGGFLLTVAFLAVWQARPADLPERLVAIEQVEDQLDSVLGSSSGGSAAEVDLLLDKLASLKSRAAPNPLKSYATKLQKWKSSPRSAFVKNADGKFQPLWMPVGCVGLVSCLLFGMGAVVMGDSPWRFAAGFVGVFLLTMLAFTMASHEVVKNLNLEYPLWALLVGLVIANTIGTPAWLRPGARTEFYIKTGLVLLGAKILLGRLIALGIPGIGVSWIVTPIVLVTTYWFGQRVLRIGSRSLNMTISADMSVCGVSAAIATAAACRAKKEELSIAIGLSLTFTVVMMFVMPAVIRMCGMSDVLGGAWLGGTVDATGAVAAAGAFLGPKAESVAITVKMIQNILIGVIAFGVALYWVTFVEPSEDGRRPSLWEIWYRFPKFVIGFVAASIVFSVVAERVSGGTLMVDSMIRGTTDIFRSWFFCMAFVSIGLETDVRALASHFQGGKPLVLYLLGQSLNLCLTLLMAWLMFEVVFPGAAGGL